MVNSIVTQCYEGMCNKTSNETTIAQLICGFYCISGLPMGKSMQSILTQST